MLDEIERWIPPCTLGFIEKNGFSVVAVVAEKTNGWNLVLNRKLGKLVQNLNLVPSWNLVPTRI